MGKAPDPLQIATRLANGKHVSFEAVMTLREAIKNPDYIAGRSEQDRQIVERALEIMAEMFKIPSVPPLPPDNGSNHSSEPPKSEPQTP